MTADDQPSNRRPPAPVTDIRDVAWKKLIRLNEKGLATAEPGNAFLMLTNGDWRGCLAYDEFGDRIFWAKSPPRLDNFTAPRAGDDLHDNHTVYVQHYLSKIGAPFTVAFRATTIDQALRAAAAENRVHPLREYLTGLRWDGTQRLPHWCHDYLGCADTPYASAVGTWWLISAVARALRPGCQADHMLVLEGAQGARKSTALRVLAGDWYLPELPDVHTKDSAHALHGRWIVECGELEALRRAEVTAFKDFVTRTVDIYRPAYGRNVVRRPRSVVFAGTTNPEQYLSDPTGARRFWPIKCGEINIPHLTETRDQLWAEARERLDCGEQWWPTAGLLPAIQEQQEERFISDSWEPIVLRWADQQLLSFTVSDVLSKALELRRDQWNKSSEIRVGVILQRAGFSSRRQMVDGRKTRQYNPKTQAI